ncbi:MAG TPA: HDIG domain-containing protein, partial [Victivallales bacterium]|nr:HDIG domain-containing protein [Victivallales bacterium]
KQIGIVAFSAISNIILNAMVIRGFYIFSSIHNLPPYVVTTVLPLAISSVILSVLIGLRVALYTGLFVSLIVAIQLDYSFPVILNGMVTSVVSGFTVRYARNYRDFFIKTLISVSLSMPLMDSLWVIAKGYETRMIVTAVKAGFFSGPFIAVLCIGLLLLIESTFRAYSNMSLITFCDYNHPLLKRMQIEAPGTYHHSLVVSNLAEQAAREIGADPIKARVGALFHDIGKLSKPEYFTENNLDGHNMHEDLSPRMSAIVILNHVKEGIELALKYKLPKIVRDCIQEHHGKDMISFFYKRALDEREENSNIHEWDYRYSGPLPRSKESVVVALADSAEAASRSLEKPTPQKVDSIIWEIFRKKIRDGQLNDADITMKELSIIRNSFVKTISTMMHGRISYPRDNNNEEDEPDLFNRTMRKSIKEN